MKGHLILIALFCTNFLFSCSELSVSTKNVIGIEDLGTTFSQFLKKIRYDHINKTGVFGKSIKTAIGYWLYMTKAQVT
jgi:hypothetical protein